MMDFKAVTVLPFPYLGTLGVSKGGGGGAIRGDREVAGLCRSVAIRVREHWRRQHVAVPRHRQAACALLPAFADVGGNRRFSNRLGSEPGVLCSATADW